MDIGRIGSQIERAGNISEISVLGRGGHVDLFALEPGLLNGLGRPGARIDVVHGLVRGGKIHGRHGELHAGAALQKKHLEALVEPHQPPGAGDGVLDDFIEPLGPMAHLGDRHARSVEVEKRRLNFLQDGKGQDGRTGIEIMDTGMHDRRPPIVGCGLVGGAVCPRNAVIHQIEAPLSIPSLRRGRLFIDKQPRP